MDSIKRDVNNIINCSKVASSINNSLWEEELSLCVSLSDESQTILIDFFGNTVMLLFAHGFKW